MYKHDASSTVDFLVSTSDISDIHISQAQHYLNEGVERIYMIDQESEATDSSRTEFVLGGTALRLEHVFPNVTTHVLSPPLADITTSHDVVKKQSGITHLSVSNMVWTYTVQAPPEK